jgi:hypothetical protein
MRRLILGLVVVVALLAGVLSPSLAFAETSANVTVTGKPTFIAITNSPNTWTINGIDGNGYISPDAQYWANPSGASGDVTPPTATVVDGDCQFTLTNASSSIPLDITVTWSDFSGGDAMTNSNDKTTNGANQFAAAAYCTDMTYSAAPSANTSGSAVMKEELSAATLKWGLYIETQSGDWSSGSVMTSNVTITATAD